MQLLVFIFILLDENNHLLSLSQHSPINHHQMEEAQLTLKDLGTHLEGLAEIVIEQGNRLQERVDIQDVKIRKITDAYISMGFIEPQYALDLIDPIRIKMLESQYDAPYWEKYHQINQELDRLLGLLKAQDNPMDVLKNIEKVIVDLFNLLNFQWKILVAQIGPICAQLKVSGDAEHAKLDEYKAVKATLAHVPSAESKLNACAYEMMELIHQQIELFEREQLLLEQMQFVCDERDRLFHISASLFLK